jgi:hypothetical protein
MAGSSTRGKSPGSGYQGAGAKTDYSSNARNSYGTEMTRSQKTDYSPNARDSYATTIERNMRVNAPTKNVPRTYAPTPKVKTRGIGSIFTPAPVVAAPVVVKKPPAKKPAVSAKPTTRGATAPTKKATPRNMPPATRFGTVTGKTTGTTVSGGGGYGGGGTRGGGSLSGQGSGSRTAGTSRTGGTKQNNPVR